MRARDSDEALSDGEEEKRPFNWKKPLPESGSGKGPDQLGWGDREEHRETTNSKQAKNKQNESRDKS